MAAVSGAQSRRKRPRASAVSELVCPEPMSHNAISPGLCVTPEYRSALRFTRAPSRGGANPMHTEPASEKPPCSHRGGFYRVYLRVTIHRDIRAMLP